MIFMKIARRRRKIFGVMMSETSFSLGKSFTMSWKCLKNFQGLRPWTPLTPCVRLTALGLPPQTPDLTQPEISKGLDPQTLISSVAEIGSRIFHPCVQPSVSNMLNLVVE